ncbi:hypothetical protein KKC17_03955 [Patescibacteria group bacterium]|nr:hypothetical protein [Patescibacteria group bacterium]
MLPHSHKNFFNQNSRRPEPQRWFGLFLAVTLVFSGLVYLVLTNSVATKGYEIKGLEYKLSTIKESYKKLEIKGTELQSLSAIKEGLAQADYVNVEKIEYLATLPPDIGVAIK